MHSQDFLKIHLILAYSLAYLLLHLSVTGAYIFKNSS